MPQKMVSYSTCIVFTKIIFTRWHPSAINMVGRTYPRGRTCPTLPYVSQSHRLAAQQSGFRKNHSTQTSLHTFLANFYSDLDNGKIIGMLALDLRKAFDIVNHKFFVDKLKHYGRSRITLNWFRSYFVNRTQMACINGSVSDPLIITTGVPQGSIIGPLLFTIYLNDLPKCLQHCKTNM